MKGIHMNHDDCDPVRITRRAALAALSMLFAAAPFRARAAAPAIHIRKDPGCACCTMWTDILKAEGFNVIEEELNNYDLIAFKRERGVPIGLVSCHTGLIEGYVIEGHVPPADIRKLIAERPEASGIAVGGMPYGSPGMGPETDREAYDVMLFKADGTTRLFTRYNAAL
ncbi:MAG: DUF411 domain-containing protein [Notoacmeibacter sp.]